jgi:hypothetical protein
MMERREGARRDFLPGEGFVVIGIGEGKISVEERVVQKIGRPPGRLFWGHGARGDLGTTKKLGTGRRKRTGSTHWIIFNVGGREGLVEEGIVVEVGAGGRDRAGRVVLGRPDGGCRSAKR